MEYYESMLIWEIYKIKFKIHIYNKYYNKHVDMEYYGWMEYYESMLKEHLYELKIVHHLCITSNHICYKYSMIEKLQCHI